MRHTPHTLLHRDAPFIFRKILTGARPPNRAYTEAKCVFIHLVLELRCRDPPAANLPTREPCAGQPTGFAPGPVPERYGPSVLRARCSLPLLLVSLLLLSACAIRPIQPQPPAAAPVPAEPAPPADDALTDEEIAAIAVVEGLAEVAGRHPMTGANLDEYMAFYADDAVMLSLPAITRAATGKTAIRDYYLTHDAEDRAYWDIEVLHVDGPVVTTRAFGHGDFTGQLPSGGFEGLGVSVIRDGKIVEDFSVPTPDSSAEMYEFIGPQDWGGPLSEIPASFEAVGTATAPWVAEAPSADTVDAALTAYSDNTVFTWLEMPGMPQQIEGKDALRALMEEWVADGRSVEFTLIGRDGTLLVGRARIWDANLEALGIAPLEAIDMYEVSDGAITHQWRVVTPDSLKALRAAQGATP